METFEILNKEGELHAFEVSNFLIGRSGACKVAKGIPGVRMVKSYEYKLFSFKAQEDEFCEFIVDGVAFTIWEPWGDSSRYWIGPKSESSPVVVSKVRAVFAAA